MLPAATATAMTTGKEVNGRKRFINIDASDQLTALTILATVRQDRGGVAVRGVGLPGPRSGALSRTRICLAEGWPVSKCHARAMPFSPPEMMAGMPSLRSPIAGALMATLCLSTVRAAHFPEGWNLHRVQAWRGGRPRVTGWLLHYTAADTCLQQKTQPDHQRSVYPSLCRVAASPHPSNAAAFWPSDGDRGMESLWGRHFAPGRTYPLSQPARERLYGTEV